MMPFPSQNKKKQISFPAHTKIFEHTLEYHTAVCVCVFVESFYLDTKTAFTEQNNTVFCCSCSCRCVVRIAFPAFVQVKVGHGGTLDPMATGVLVIGVGKGCRELGNYLQVWW